eukprot:scaffold160199_cov31-Prasinocladus_malaysianus.AAC.1
MQGNVELQAHAAAKASRPPTTDPRSASAANVGATTATGAQGASLGPTGPVNTHGIARLGQSMLVSELPAAVDT